MNFIILIFNLTIYMFYGDVTGEKCRKNQYQCFDGSCIPLRGFCDGHVECEDKSDEFNCPNECLLRHELYEEDESIGYQGNRRMTKDGKKCISPCRGIHGRMVGCVTETNTTMSCDVPYCSLYNSWTGRTCDLTASLCGWSLYSNSEMYSWEQQDTTSSAKFLILGHNFTYARLTSPILTQVIASDFIKFNVSVSKPKNVYWSTKIWRQEDMDGERFPNPIRKWSLQEKEFFILQEQVSSTQYRKRRKIYAYFFFYGFGYYNVTVDLQEISILDHSEAITNYNCGSDEFECSPFSGSCIPVEFVGDGFVDCEHGKDESVTETEETVTCDENQMKCPSSGVCISTNASASLKKQCKSNSTSRPYVIQNTSCPNDFECKREFGMLDNGTAICLNATNLCDGVPHCPYWDDEVNCPSVCPTQCMDCSLGTYKCRAENWDSIPRNAKNIDLSEQNVNITKLCSEPRIRLSSLNLSSVGLTDLACLFNHTLFPSLGNLDVSDNKITNTSIHGFGMSINLDRNQGSNLKILSALVSKLSLRDAGIEDLKWVYRKPRHAYLCINCDHTDLDVSEDSCPTCKFLFCIQELNLTGNAISDISFIINCTFLIKLDISFNSISSFGNRPYHSTYLKEMYINHNSLTAIETSVFKGMTTLTFIDLSWNRIAFIEKTSFHTLDRLRVLDLSSNRLHFLHSSVFHNLKRLQHLSLSQNVLEDLPSLLFKDLAQLVTLDLSCNNIRSIKNELFDGLLSLKELDLSGNLIDANERMFDRLVVLHYMKVEDFSLCCARPKSLSSSNCKAPSTIISSCSNLIGSGFLGVYVWVIAVVLFFGNTSILLSTIKARASRTKMCPLLDIAIAEIFLSLYLFIIALKDVESRGHYGFEDKNWRKSAFCDLADVFYSISLEASTLVPLILLLEKRLSRELRGLEQILIFAFVWCFSICVSVLPKLRGRVDISITSICVHFPISTFLKERFFSEYLVVLHLVVNVSISVGVIILKVKQIHRDKFKRTWMTSEGILHNKHVDYFVRVTLARNFCIYVAGYLVMFDIDVVGYDWITLFLIPSCSVANLCVRWKLRQGRGNDQRVLIKEVFSAKRTPLEKRETLVILMNTHREIRSRNIKDIEVLVIDTENNKVLEPVNIKVVRKVILAHFPAHLDTIGQGTTLKVSIQKGKNKTRSYRLSQ